LQALVIDPDSAEAHNSLGYVQFYHDWKWADAEKSFRRAHELNPGYGIGHQWYANVLCRGQLDAALREMRKARELDPLSLIINAAVGFVHHLRRDHGRAIEVLDRTQEMDADFFTGRLWSGWAYLAQGKYGDAIGELNHAVRISGSSPFALADLAHAHAVAGHEDQARLMLAELIEKREARRYMSPMLIAQIHCGLGEIDATFEWLEQAFSDREHWLVFLGQDPRFDPLKDDPRFAKLLERIDRGGPT
jgi:tetratricopeptide (TPR) repeat protein